MTDPVATVAVPAPSAILSFRERLWFQVEKTVRSGHFWVAAIVATIAGIVKDMDSATLLTLTNAFPFLKGYTGIIVPFAIYLATAFKPSNAIGPQTQALIDAAVRSELAKRGVSVKPAAVPEPLPAEPLLSQFDSRAPRPKFARAPEDDPELAAAMAVVKAHAERVRGAQRVLDDLADVMLPRAARAPLEPHPLNSAPITVHSPAPVGPVSAVPAARRAR